MDNCILNKVKIVDVVEPALLNVEDTAKYLSISETTARELMKTYGNTFVVKIGNRKYSHKAKLDRWLSQRVGLN